MAEQRLIDANELIPLIKMGECNMYDEYCQGRNGGIAFAIERIKQMSTIEERKTGKWSEAERQKSEKFYCSVCGGRAYHPWIGNRKSDRKNVCRYRFFPHCGARMQEGEDNG